MNVTVAAGGRLHFGFRNLSLARERLYGAVGIGLAEPRVRVRAAPAATLECADPTARAYAETALDLLELPGATVTVEEPLPRHVGLGSGTQLACAVLTAVARAHRRESRVRERAPTLGRGGRSGIGVATFCGGGAIADVGHPASAHTPEPPANGEWETPPVDWRESVPDPLRFLLVLPDVPAGRDGDAEDRSIRRVVERADPRTADRVEAAVGRLRAGLRTGDPERVGSAVDAIDRLNGRWYADVQGGCHRDPVGTVVDSLAGAEAVDGAGQSSWGPAVYGVTDVDRAAAARAAGQRALDAAGVAGTVRVVRAADRGADVTVGTGRIESGVGAAVRD